MPKCGFILIIISTRIEKIRIPRLACFALHNLPAWLMWCGDYPTYKVEVMTATVEWLWLCWIPIAVRPRVVGSPLFFSWLRATQIVAATLKTRSDRADDAVTPKSSTSSIQIGETTYVFTKPQNRVVQSMGRGPKVARELTFRGPQKRRISMQALRILKSIARAGFRLL